MRITEGIILAQIEYLVKKHGFNERIGWAQVNGRGEAINRVYGRYEALLDLLSD